MAPIFLLLIVSSSLFIPSYTQNFQSTDQGAFISLLITQQGLDFAKNYLLNQTLPSAFPLKLPNLEKKTKIPLLGTLEIALSNITINDFDLLSSDVKPGDNGITISTSGVAGNISTSWYYKFYTSHLPLKVSDEGNASIQFEGTQAGFTLGLENQNGTLELSLDDYSFHVKDLSIKVHGGKHWPYQRLAESSKMKVEAALVNAITKKIKEEIVKLNSLLQSLPTEITVYGNASIDLSLAKPPSFSNSSIQLDFNGLIGGKSNISVPSSGNEFSSICSSKMLGVLVDVGVINSASATLYDDFQWVVDEIPGQNLLNTAGWKFVIPTLYMKYPNCDMNFDISLSSPPTITISDDQLEARVYAGMTINVLKGDEVIPVFALSVNISGVGTADISGNKIVGGVEVSDFSISVKSSSIGNLPEPLVQVYFVFQQNGEKTYPPSCSSYFPLFVRQIVNSIWSKSESTRKYASQAQNEPVIQTLLQTFFLPTVNTLLEEGFPLPSFDGFGFNNAEINYSDTKIALCSDVELGQSSWI